MKAPAGDPGDFCIALRAESTLLIPEIAKSADTPKRFQHVSPFAFFEVGFIGWIVRVGFAFNLDVCDGIHVLRTSEPAERLWAEDTVPSYKSLGEVERAFRCLKGIDLLVRLIRHRAEDRVPAHIFLCVLAYYVEWHLRRAWAPLLFEDEERREERRRRDPILPARTAQEALAPNCGWDASAKF